MADQQNAPDPARSYERAKPEDESGMGRLDHPAKNATPTNRPDQQDAAVTHKQDPDRANAQDDDRKP